MPKVHLVKKARKDNPVAKAGESYYWWKLMMGSSGVKRFSKTYPKPSQLTSSWFKSQLYAARESLEVMTTLDQDALDGLISEMEDLLSECDNSLEALPDSLQSSPTGELIEDRLAAIEEYLVELGDIDLETTDGEEALQVALDNFPDPE